MSCGVCIYLGDGDDGSLGYRCVIVKAGQNWKCCECGLLIKKGERYELASGFGVERDYHWNAKTCLICAEIATAFQCEARWHGRDFWEHMPFDKLTTSCFTRLTTPEAKAELQRRWMQWKGIA